MYNDNIFYKIMKTSLNLKCWIESQTEYDFVNANLKQYKFMILGFYLEDIFAPHTQHESGSRKR